MIAVRWHRRELSPMMAAVHIAAEYLPLLAFEPVLGHAGDPVLWPEGLSAAGSRFGVIGDRDCDHTKAEQSAANRTLRVAVEPGEGWRAYFDRQHSQVAGALATCVAGCRNPCAAMDWVAPSAREDLAVRAKVALMFADTPWCGCATPPPWGTGSACPRRRRCWTPGTAAAPRWTTTRSGTAPRWTTTSRCRACRACSRRSPPRTWSRPPCWTTSRPT
ncbi:hypothetical protein [Thermocatellispora tengchongensis]|uniref:hypothetical protein n=1 Tax=Thermocatellispora tengchongensis TaxID=1073253 RepID=UPI0036321525